MRIYYLHAICLFSFLGLHASEFSERPFKKAKIEESLVTLKSAEGESFSIEQSAVSLSEMLKAAFDIDFKEKKTGVYTFVEHDSQAVSHIKNFLQSCHFKKITLLIDSMSDLDEISRIEFKAAIDYLILNDDAIKWITQATKEHIILHVIDIDPKVQSLLDCLPMKDTILKEVFKNYKSTLNRMLLNALSFKQEECAPQSFDPVTSPGYKEIIDQPNKPNNLVIEDINIVLNNKKLCFPYLTGIPRFCYYISAKKLFIIIVTHKTTYSGPRVLIWDITSNNAQPNKTFNMPLLFVQSLFLAQNLLFVGDNNGNICVFDITSSSEMIESVITFSTDCRVIKHLKVEDSVLYFSANKLIKWGGQEEPSEYCDVTKKIDLARYFKALKLFKENLSLKDILVLKTLSV